MTENIMIQETEMTKTGFCEMCDAQTDRLETCMECGERLCPECCSRGFGGYYCENCVVFEEDDDE